MYSLKPTIGSTDLDGIFIVDEAFDALGAMARSSHDLALITEILLKTEARAKIPSDGFLSFMKKDFNGLRIGFIDAKEWHWPENIQPQHANSAE